MNFSVCTNIQVIEIHNRLRESFTDSLVTPDITDSISSLFTDSDSESDRKEKENLIQDISNDNPSNWRFLLQSFPCCQGLHFSLANANLSCSQIHRRQIVRVPRDASRATLLDSAITQPPLLKSVSPALSHFKRFGSSLKPLTMERPSRRHYAAAIGLTARVARDSAFWPARYLDRNKFTLNYLLRAIAPARSRSFSTCRFRAPLPFPCHPPPPHRNAIPSGHPADLYERGRMVRFVVGADFNFSI